MQDITDAQQDFINRHFFNLTLFALIFGVMFYDVIGYLGFGYVDEICAVLLFSLFGYKVSRSKTWEFDRLFLITLGIFLFYLIYSFAIESNSAAGILTDFVIQIKPYISFFCVYAMKPAFGDNRKKVIRQVIALCYIYVFVIGVLSPVSNIIDYTFVHPSRLATASSVLALLYLYCSNYTKTDKIVFVVILAIGLFSGRSKHFGFFTCCSLMIFYLNQSFRMKLNTRNILLIAIVIALTIVAAWEKIHFYFITGGFGDERTANDLFARMALYYYSTIILMDYIPFGTGFGSYATYASAVYYSPIYAKYGMENMSGIEEHAPIFLADTYYPALTQFGFVGIMLFFGFWIRLTAKAVRYFKAGFRKEAVIALMIVVFFIIECTSDATITHNRGMFIMMILGLVFSDMNKYSALSVREKEKEKEINDEQTVAAG
ncbi:MAG: O-antigen ligase domain-containing protein [Tannerella sp.]|jgi:hypothetical protein|nr:O-antigen ligase domain-containing protein [Tannerella sp.]